MENERAEDDENVSISRRLLQNEGTSFSYSNGKLFIFMLFLNYFIPTFSSAL